MSSPVQPPVQPPVHPDSQRPRLPAEWESQAALMLTWPHEAGDWGDALPAAERCLEEIASAAARFQPLLISGRDAGHVARIRNRLIDIGVPGDRLILGEAASNDIWVRDHGPITVIRPGGDAQLLDFCFNGWGERHASDLDDWLTRRLTEGGVFGAGSYRRIQWVLEGGSIDADGFGTVLTTTACLLNPNRNPGANREQIEEQLLARLGVRRVLWLEHGWLEGDDTDSHVDMLARFVSRDTIAHAVCDDPNDPHHEPLAQLQEELQSLRTTCGEPYRLIPLPLPAPRYDGNGNRLPATYANFVFINGAVLVPAYDDPNDAVAAARLAASCGDREIVSVHAGGLIQQGGSLHCATMQLPEAVHIAAVPVARPAADGGRSPHV